MTRTRTLPFVAETNPNPPPGTIDVVVDPASPTASSSFGQANPAPAAPAAPSPQAPYRLRGPRRRWTIILGITTTALITALSLTLLYFKWYRTVDYNAMVIAWGEPEWDGATATLTGPALGNDALAEKFSSGRNYMIRFHVPPGTYQIIVKSHDGRVLGSSRLHESLRSGYQWWPFRDPLNTTRPSTSGSVK